MNVGRPHIGSPLADGSGTCDSEFCWCRQESELQRLARALWERAVLAMPPGYPEDAARSADELTAEWRKRFDPQEGA